MKHSFFVLLALTASLPAAQPPAELKAFLNLSDAQLQSLIQNRQQLAQAVQPVAQQAQQKQQALQQLLEGVSPDPVAVGKLVIEITGFGKQVQQLVQNSQQTSVNILTPEQQARLQVLGDVLKLQAPAMQAVAVGLLTPPNPPQGQAAAQTSPVATPSWMAPASRQTPAIANEL